MTKFQKNIKNYLTNLITENLHDFDLVDGGQQRTIGDLVEKKVVEIVSQNHGEIITEVKLSTGKKSMEDVSVVSEGVTYMLDPKSHNTDSEFSMPNLSSISRIKKLFDNNKKEMMYVFVDYKIDEQVVRIEKI